MYWWILKTKSQWNVKKTLKNAYSYLNKRVLYKKKEKNCNFVTVTSNGGLWGYAKICKKSKKVKNKLMEWNEYKLLKIIDMQ